MPRDLIPADAAPDAEIDALQALLDAVPAPLEPLGVSALDGFLCGVILQPRPVPAEQWLARALDPDGRPPPPGWDPAPLQAAVHRRHAALLHSIDARAWFDPWIFAPDGDDGGGDDDSPPPTESVLPWVTGFALALDLFPALAAVNDPELVEPLALLYLHFDPADLEDADALLAVIDTLEPPTDLGEAVQDLVRALMLIADVTRPRRAPPRATRPGPPRGRRR
ncbi:MAG: YecA family protein [Rubrivivax sp.]